MILNKIKMLSILIIFTLFVNQANAAITFGGNSDYSDYSKETRKLERLQKSLIKSLDKDFNESIKTVSGSLDKAYIKQEFNYIKSEIENYYPYSKESTISEFKKDVKFYKNLKSTIQDVKTGKQVYKISFDENKSVENDIVSIQKDFVKSLKEYTDKYLKSDYTDEGDFEYSFSSEDFGNINIKSSKYKTVYSFLTNSQEFNLVLNMNFDLKSKEIENFSFKGNIDLDLNIKVIDNDLYISLNSYDLDIDSSKISDKETKLLLDEKIKTITSFLDKYKGKKIKIVSSIDESTLSSSDEIVKFVSEGLDKFYNILENQSLFSVYKNVGNKKVLKLNLKTTYNLLQVLKPQDKITYSSYLKEFKDDNTGFVVLSPLYFEKNNNSIKFTNNLISTYGNGIQTLEKKDGNYIYNLNYSGDIYNSKFSYEMYFDKNKFSSNLVSDNFKSKILWEKNYLNASITGLLGQNFILKGDLSDEKINLIGKLNNQEVLTCKVNKLGKDNYSYDFNFNLAEFNKMNISVKGKSKLTFGKFPINVPNIDETISMDELNKILDINQGMTNEDYYDDEYSIEN